MSLPVSLKDVVEAMEPLSDEWQAWINRKTGELVCFTEDEMCLLDADDSDFPEWQQEQLPKLREVLSSDDFVQLPGKYDFNEYRLMEDFVLSLDDSALQRELAGAIRGKGAFRRFKDLVAVAGIREQWFARRDEALKALAVEFLEEEGIPFVE
jgi:hypothetical protein